jgi:hypothetical protein
MAPDPAIGLSDDDLLGLAQAPQGGMSDAQGLSDDDLLGRPAVQSQSSNRFAPDREAAASGLMSSLEYGAGDVTHGIGQMGAHAVVAVDPFIGAEQKQAIDADVDKKIQDREAQYDAQRKASGDTGTDWWRLAGRVATAAPLAYMAGPIVGGAIGAAATPENDFSWGTKAGEAAIGGAGGAALKYAPTVARAAGNAASYPWRAVPSSTLDVVGQPTTESVIGDTLRKGITDSLAKMPTNRASQFEADLADRHGLQPYTDNAAAIASKVFANRDSLAIAKRLIGPDATEDAARTYVASKLDNATSLVPMSGSMRPTGIRPGGNASSAAQAAAGWLRRNNDWLNPTTLPQTYAATQKYISTLNSAARAKTAVGMAYGTAMAYMAPYWARRLLSGLP